MFQKRVSPILMILLISTWSFVTPHVQAVDLTDLQREKEVLEQKKSDIESNIQEKDRSMNANQSEIDAILSELQSINLEINKLDESVEFQELIIIEAMEEVELMLNTMLGLENKTIERDIVLRERIRALQAKGGTISYLDVILGSSSFADFIDRFNTVTVLLDADRRILKQQAEDHEEMQKVKTQFDTKLDNQKARKFELEETRSTLNSLRSDKDILIDELELIQAQLTAEKSELENDYEETYQMSVETERAIQDEQQRIFQAEQKRMSSAFCQASDEVDKDAYSKRLKNAGVFRDKGPMMISIAEEYGIDPVLLAAIAIQETKRGTSNAVVLYNNPGGLMDPADNWSSLLRFDTLEDGLRSMGKTMSRLILKEGRVTIQQLGSAYAPVGASNDPLGLNEYWVPNVTKNVASFGGLVMNCEAQQVESIGSSSTDETWARPATGTMTSQFGWRTDPFTKQERQHRGLDIANSVGTPVMAAGGGVVSKAGWHDSYGNVIMITHVIGGQAYTTVYAHLSDINVNEGDQVGMSQQIGKMGSTGRASGPHLHFEFHVGYYSGSGNSAVNPLRYVSF